MAANDSCPKCGHFGSVVVDSRRPNEYYRTRRHECVSCLHRWTTAEVPLALAQELMRAGRLPREGEASASRS